eukprot:2515123-Alexandrium_andersonii.AAC.1
MLARRARAPAGHPLRALCPRRKRLGCLADTTFGPSLSSRPRCPLSYRLGPRAMDSWSTEWSPARVPLET